MRRTSIVMLLAVLAAAAAYGQPSLTGVKLTSYVGFTPLPITEGKTPQASPCVSSPYTTDSKIYTVILKLMPQISGATEMKQLPNVWTDAANAQLIYLLTGSPGISQVKTSRRSYDQAFVNAAAEIVVPDLTWADASDILTELQKSPATVTGLQNAIISAGSLSLLPITLPAGSDANDLLQAIGDADPTASFHFQGGWAKVIQIAKTSPPKLTDDNNVAGSPVAGTPIALKLPTDPASITINFVDAPKDLQGLVNSLGIKKAVANGNATSTPGAPPENAIFLVDSPCLTVTLLPAVTGTNLTGGELAFNGHYLFPFAKGHSFAKIDVGGTSPINQNQNGSTNTLTALLDLALNHDMNVAEMSGPVRFTGGLTTSLERMNVSGGDHTSKGSGGLKGSVSFPGVGLTGNDTRPTLTFEAVGSTVNGTSSDTSQFEGNAKFKAKFRWTPIFNSAIDAAYSLSHDAIYGNRKNNYLITVDVLKFIVREPLEFAATWKCGRPAPDYNRVCGFYTGLSLTSNQ